MNLFLICVAAFCLIHIVRDLLQIKYGYKHWFMRIGRIWHAPEHEVHGMIVFAIVGIASLYFAFN